MLPSPSCRHWDFGFFPVEGEHKRALQGVQLKGQNTASTRGGAALRGTSLVAPPEGGPESSAPEKHQGGGRQKEQDQCSYKTASVLAG